jgi:Zn2+/Cd2+-exporting ATPase
MPSAKRTAIKIDELDCAEEMLMLRREFQSLPGIQSLDFNVVQGRMDVVHDEQQIGPSEIIQRIERLGMHGRIWQRRPKSEQPSRETVNRQRLLTACGMALLLGFILHAIATGSLLLPFVPLIEATGRTSSFGVPQFLYLTAILLGLAPVAPRAWGAMRRARADMNVLVCVAVLGAMLLGEWLEGAMVAFLFGLALTLEHGSLVRARQAISALLDLAPETARCRQADGTWSLTPLESVPVGTIVQVQPGERIPLDGVVRGGGSHVDQAPITGESVPVFKQPGDELYAGSLNGESLLELQTTRTHEHSTLSRILQLVEEAHSQKASGEIWIERFAATYTPLMIGLALAIALVPPLVGMMTLTDAFYRALVLLLIACPCALVISTPVTFITALATSARHGVLLKGGRFLEAAARCRVFVFDKTGTLTTGVPVVTDVLPAPGVSEQELLRAAVQLESHVRHPLARAVLERAQAEALPITSALEGENVIRMLAGRGVEAKVGDSIHWLGGMRLASERLSADSRHVLARLLETGHAHHESGQSLIVVGMDDRVLGLLLAAESIRPAARPVMERLRGLGVESLWMLTGDEPSAARRVAERTGVENFRAGLLPEQKVEHLRQLVEQYETVAMVGDGVNDSPALAAASLGVAMGAIGSDAALEAADVALMSDELERLPWLIEHGRRTLSVLQTNVALALGIKLLFVLLAAVGYATLWSAIAADMGTSLLVIFLALRLRR